MKRTEICDLIQRSWVYVIRKTPEIHLDAIGCRIRPAFFIINKICKNDVLGGGSDRYLIRIIDLVLFIIIRFFFFFVGKRAGIFHFRRIVGRLTCFLITDQICQFPVFRQVLNSHFHF